MGGGLGTEGLSTAVPRHLVAWVMAGGGASAAVVGGFLVIVLVGAIAATSGAPSGMAVLGGAVDASKVPDQSLVPWLNRAGSLCPTFPASVIAAQIQSESNWRPDAVSPAGAMGIAQFVPGTWPAYAQDDDGSGNVSPLNPADAIMAAGRYDCSLAQSVAPLATKTGISTLSLALAAYNAGEKAVTQAGGMPPIPQTQAYVAKIEALAPSFVSAGANTSAVNGFGAAVVSATESQLGVAYVWGGGSPSGPTAGGFDCSGLVLYSVWQASAGQVDLPHSSEIQATMGQAVDASSVQPGDVIAFQLSTTGVFDHIAIYIGSGQAIEAPHTGSVVRIVSLASFGNVPFTVRQFG
jgi:cell wall-associated NlpC family hydrolase